MTTIAMSMEIEKAPHLKNDLLEISLSSTPNRTLEHKRLMIEEVLKVFRDRLEVEFLHDGDGTRLKGEE